MTDYTAKINKKSLLIELAVVTGALLVVSHFLYLFRSVSFISNYISTIVAILFLYLPVIVLWKRCRKIDFIDKNLKSIFYSVLAFLISAIIVFPIFLLLAHVWQITIAGKTSFSLAAYPQFFSMSVFQLLLIALPEEFFFRGYFQSTIDLVFKKKIKFLGVRIGWGFVITAIVFAFAHSIVVYQWWHFSIFFPALLFGYLRLRTGSILAPILFHAASNIIMDWFVRCYS